MHGPFNLGKKGDLLRKRKSVAMQTGELVKPGMDRILMALKLPLVDLPTYDGISRLRSKVRRDAEQIAIGKRKHGVTFVT